jgi:hypothetical protein
VRRITTLAVLAVALVAAIASYDHQRALAELAGEGWRAWLLPVSVDGLVVAASMSMLVRRRVGLPQAHSPGHLCSQVSERASPPTSPPLTPRRWGASSLPGRPSPCCSPGSCSCTSERQPPPPRRADDPAWERPMIEAWLSSPSVAACGQPDDVQAPGTALRPDSKWRPDRRCRARYETFVLS